MNCSLLVATTACLAASAAQANPADTMRRIHDPHGGLIVVAHRGCHEAAPLQGLGSAPENSGAALLHCVDLGADVMETDVRRSRDGYLVMVHDDSVDRTTNGTGKVSELTLAQLKALRLRADEGGADAALTDQTIPTLAEILALAKGRIVLNLDVKDAIYGEVIAAVEDAGAGDRVIVKTSAGIGSAPLAAMPPYDQVPFMVIPVSADARASDLPAIITRQIGGRIKPIAIELPILPVTALPTVTAQAQALGVTVWINTLFHGFVTGLGGDPEARRDPQAVWGWLADQGARIFQTDAVESLVRYRAQRHGKALRSGQPWPKCASGDFAGATGTVLRRRPVPTTVAERWHRRWLSLPVRRTARCDAPSTS